MIGYEGPCPSIQGFKKRCENGKLDETIRTMCLMYQQGICVSYTTFYHLLQWCISNRDLAAGNIVYCFIIRSGCESNSFLGSHLIRMFVVLGSLSEANKVFSKLVKPNTFAWSAIISAHAKHGQSEQAIKLYNYMQRSSAQIDEYVFVAVLKACSHITALKQGQMIHAHIFGMGLERVGIVGNTLIDMYAKCESLKDAHSIFNNMSKRDVVTWNSMISGFACHGYGEMALQIFHHMLQENVGPDNVTFIGILKACSSINALQQSRLIHGLVIESGFDLNVCVGSSLLDTYAKCGSLEDAHEVFAKLQDRNLVVWTAISAGYTEHGCSRETLQIFHQMQQEGLNLDNIAFVSILQACSKLIALDQAKVIHALTIQYGIEFDVFVGSALIDMYFKCGSIEGAHSVFHRLPKQNVVGWNAMIAGLGQNDEHVLALQCFKDMQIGGIKPDEATFVSLLSACSHGGLVERGCEQFLSMRLDHGINPTLDHYICMVDLLGRAGCVNEAEALLRTMPFQPCDVGWRSLLSNCRTCGNIKVGQQCSNHSFGMDVRDSSVYLLVSNMYSDACMWERAEKIEEQRNCERVWKKPGNAMIEVDRKVYDFTVGEKDPLKDNIIKAKLESMSGEIKVEGYVPLVDSRTTSHV